MADLRLMIVAGEASGDSHAAKLVTALRQAVPEASLDIFGCAGPNMRTAGVEPIVNADHLSVVGLAEIAGALPMFLRVWQKLVRTAEERRPDAVILVDFPDFNLKLARRLKKSGNKVIYYISPQLWAWRQYRLASIKKYVDLLLTILPFEDEWYRSHGIGHTQYVGSPLAREVHRSLSREEFAQKYGLRSEDKIVALLPGSRDREIVRILPVMIEAAAIVAAADPQTQFVIPVSSSHAAKTVNKLIEGSIGASSLVVVDDTYNVIAAADAAAVTSGTATLETAILGTPLVVVYKTSAINYALLEPLISVDHYGLVNLIAGERVAAELIQGDLEAGSLASHIIELLRPVKNSEMRAKLKEVADKLGHGGASRRAAQAILGLLGSRG